MRVFISYRRSDTENTIARIHDRMDLFFGPNRFFRDIDDIRGGEPFKMRLDLEVSACDLGLVAIGPSWESCKQNEQLRLFQNTDAVRLEIIDLLKSNKPVIPVLIDRVIMPSAAALPTDIWPLLDIQAVRISSGYGFDANVYRLVTRISDLLHVRYQDYHEVLKQCRSVGLLSILDNFQYDQTAIDEIATAKEMIVIQNDGAAWIDSNQELLRLRLADKSKSTKVVLYHPQSRFLEILDAKNQKGMDKQIAEIRNSYRLLVSLAIHEGNFAIRAHHGFNPYALILTENKAFMDPYLLNRRGALPRLIFGSEEPRSLYHTLRSDALTLFDKAEPLTSDSFAP